jgi:hypothetical protein
MDGVAYGESERKRGLTRISLPTFSPPTLCYDQTPAPQRMGHPRFWVGHPPTHRVWATRPTLKVRPSEAAVHTRVRTERRETSKYVAATWAMPKGVPIPTVRRVPYPSQENHYCNHRAQVERYHLGSDLSQENCFQDYTDWGKKTDCGSNPHPSAQCAEFTACGIHNTRPKLLIKLSVAISRKMSTVNLSGGSF